MNIQEYIDSGILEAFVLGGASDDEVRELLQYKEKFPEVAQALHALEIDMERIAGQMAMVPPPGTWTKIENQINELATIPEADFVRFKEPRENGNGYAQPGGNDFIHVESESSHMRIHKNWKWVLAAVFVLGKIFLGFAIYFYLENRQAQEQVQELKTELRELKAR